MSNTAGTLNPYPRTIDDVMASQYPTINGWICPQCRNHKGNLKCSKGVLICWVGANMSRCSHFIEERRKEAP